MAGFGKDGKGAMIREDATLTLTTLDVDTGKVVNGPSADLEQDFRILKSEIHALVIGLTAGEGRALSLYMTEGELTATEAIEAIETNGPVAQADRDIQEHAERWVRLVGVGQPNDIADVQIPFVGAEGSPIINFKPRWTFSQRPTSGEGGWNWMVYNHGPQLTTGSSLRMKATHYGVWVR